MAHIQLIGVSEAASLDGKIWKFPYALPIVIRGLIGTTHTFSVLDTHLHKKSEDELFDFLKKCDAKVYGISGFSHNYVLVKEMAKTIREKHPDAVIIVGGVLSGNDMVLMRCTEADIVSTAAEGERVLPEILDALNDGKPLDSIKGITYKDKNTNKIIVTPKITPMSKEEFRNMPLPAYEYFDKELTEMVHNINSQQDVPVKGFPLLTSRGCPFHCTFCGQLHGRKFLRKNWDSFFDEVEFLINRYGIQGIYSYDTNMFLNEKEVDEYCEVYRKRKHTFKSCVELRPTFGNYEMFKKLKEHGVEVILFGIESGSQYILDRMRKNFDVNKMKKVFKSAIDAGLMIHGNFLFGTPGECPATIEETRQLMVLMEKWIFDQKRTLEEMGKNCTSGYGWSILIPSPPSELYDVAVRTGLIKNEEDYLLSLGDKNALKLVKGSKFKIALAELGGNVNMSEFPSKRSLLECINYSNALVKLMPYFWDKRQLITNIPRILVIMSRIVKCYIKYIFLTTVDSKNRSPSVATLPAA